MNEPEQSALVLVVDDQLASVQMLERMFQMAGYQVLSAREGKTALTLAFEHQPTLILLDVMMPEMNGFDVLARLRNEPSTVKTPVILITGLDSTDYIEQGLRLGADDYVTKPFNSRELLARAASKIHAYQLEHQLLKMQQDYAEDLERRVEQRTRELKSAQTLLIQADRLASVGRLAASIAHEINNPLQPIVVLLEDMTHDVKQNILPDVEALQVIQDNVMRIRRIVGQLLDFTGKNSLQVETQPVDLQTVLLGVIHLNRKLFEHKKLLLIADFRPVQWVYANQDQLQQVFMNLTINAHAALTEGVGQLVIRLYDEGDWVCVQFVDNGHGITSEHLTHIFDPFFTTKAEQGNGLGLFVSYGIVQNHGGRIDVHSEPQQGTTFTIWLPAYTKP